jgi:hypothetical protein
MDGPMWRWTELGPEMDSWMFLDLDWRDNRLVLETLELWKYFKGMFWASYLIEMVFIQSQRDLGMRLSDLCFLLPYHLSELSSKALSWPVQVFLIISRRDFNAIMRFYSSSRNFVLTLTFYLHSLDIFTVWYRLCLSWLKKISLDSMLYPLFSFRLETREHRLNRARETSRNLTHLPSLRQTDRWIVKNWSLHFHCPVAQSILRPFPILYRTSSSIKFPSNQKFCWEPSLIVHPSIILNHQWFLPLDQIFWHVVIEQVQFLVYFVIIVLADVQFVILLIIFSMLSPFVVNVHSMFLKINGLFVAVWINILPSTVVIVFCFVWSKSWWVSTNCECRTFPQWFALWKTARSQWNWLLISVVYIRSWIFWKWASNGRYGHCDSWKIVPLMDDTSVHWTGRPLNGEESWNQRSSNRKYEVSEVVSGGKKWENWRRVNDRSFEGKLKNEMVL